MEAGTGMTLGPSGGGRQYHSGDSAIAKSYAQARPAQWSRENHPTRSIRDSFWL